MHEPVGQLHGAMGRPRGHRPRTGASWRRRGGKGIGLGEDIRIARTEGDGRGRTHFVPLSHMRSVTGESGAESGIAHARACGERRRSAAVFSRGTSRGTALLTECTGRGCCCLASETDHRGVTEPLDQRRWAGHRPSRQRYQCARPGRRESTIFARRSAAKAARPQMLQASGRFRRRQADVAWGITRDAGASARHCRSYRARPTFAEEAAIPGWSGDADGQIAMIGGLSERGNGAPPG